MFDGKPGYFAIEIHLVILLFFQVCSFSFSIGFPVAIATFNPLNLNLHDETNPINPIYFPVFRDRKCDQLLPFFQLWQRFAQ